MLNPEQIERISTVGLSRCMEWHPGGIKEWRPSDWAMALSGEAGELSEAVLLFHYLGVENNLTESDMLNCRSILHAVDEVELIETVEKFHRDIMKETADVYFYLDLVAQQFDMQLVELIAKWRGAPVVPNWPKSVPYGVMSSRLSNMLEIEGGTATSLMIVANAVSARVGSVDNLGKKLRRIEDKMRQANAPHLHNLMELIGYEIRNVYVHLEAMAEVGKFDLHEALVRTFNNISERENFEHRL